MSDADKAEKAEKAAEGDRAHTLADAGRLVRRIREKQAEVYALTEELTQLLAAGPSTQEHIRRLAKTWSDLWGGQYGETYNFARGKDAAGLRRILRLLPVEEIEARMRRYLVDQDRFFRGERHPLSLFCMKINRFGQRTPQGELTLDASPVDCHEHTPPCRTDEEHTRKKLADLRRQPPT